MVEIDKPEEQTEESSSCFYFSTVVIYPHEKYKDTGGIK